MNKSILVELSNVGKVFYTDRIETHALSNVNLTIEKGEYVSISGPSGCGKSTLLSIIGLLDEPSSGSYFLNAGNVTRIDATERSVLRNRHIGFVFQSFNLIGELSVIKNVELPLKFRGVKARERKEMAKAALDKLGMSGRMDHYPTQLSGGQQQRVAVARAISGGVEILLADEPTGNLDSKNAEAVMGILQSLNEEGTTICMVTHDERFAKAAGREVGLLDGKVLQSGLDK